MACFEPYLEIGPVCLRANLSVRDELSIRDWKIGDKYLSGRDGTANGLPWTILEIVTVLCGLMKALVAPGSLFEVSH